MSRELPVFFDHKMYKQKVYTVHCRHSYNDGTNTVYEIVHRVLIFFVVENFCNISPYGVHNGSPGIDPLLRY